MGEPKANRELSYAHHCGTTVCQVYGPTQPAALPEKRDHACVKAGHLHAK